MNSGGKTSARCRAMEDYIIGPKIGSGSFAVVWKSKHRKSGIEYAIKEIDKKNLNESMRKEISILRNITHPNIIRLFEAVETEERIYLVLEYCHGGDLGAYIHRHGRVSEDTARHFMKQLGAGLQVLRENNLIHRDLKPQNLLLSSRELTPLLKIGDFGFARYLTPQGLADTLCGSPLYMAPEIIQNQRYDAKADLWSVGAICYQLVIGKPPYGGNNQLQLFQNILQSTTLQFPEETLQALNPDYVEFCRGLLRRNPVERLTFEEFFNHKFLMGSRHLCRAAVNAESPSQISQVGNLDLTDNHGPLSHHDDEMKALEDSVKQDCSINDENRYFKDPCDVSRVTPNISSDKIRQTVEDGPQSLSQTRVAYSLDSIEGEYVFVHSNFASTEILTSSLGTSLKEVSATKACALAPKINDKQLPVMPDMNKLTVKLVGSDNVLRTGMNLSAASGSPSILREAQDLHSLHPSTRLKFINQYVDALSNLAREKLNAGFFLESFSVELLVLTLWKEAIRICNSWLLKNGLPESSSGNDSAGKKAASSLSKTECITDFTNPSSVSIWAEKGFIDAYDGTEKLSKYIQDVDGAAEMPDAMEIIFQTAIAAGKDGAADEFFGNRDSAAAMYSKALLLFSFIVSGAPSFPLNPPFLLAPDSKQQILKYIKSLEYHLSHSNVAVFNDENARLWYQVNKR